MLRKTLIIAIIVALMLSGTNYKKHKSIVGCDDAIEYNSYNEVGIIL